MSLISFLPRIELRRQDRAVQVWRAWILEDPSVHPYRRLRPDVVPPSSFLQCDPSGTVDGSGVLADPALIDREFRKAWLPCFLSFSPRDADIEDVSAKVEGGGLPTLGLVDLPILTGEMLSYVVKRKKVTGGCFLGLMGWGVSSVWLTLMGPGRRVCLTRTLL